MKFITMANREYIPAANALFKSIEANGGLTELEFFVLSIDDLDGHETDRFDHTDTEVEQIHASDLGEFEFDTTLLGRANPLNLHKFLIYKIPYDGPVCYLDADIVCVNEISALERFEEFTACINIGKENPQSVCHRPMFNSGFFVFEPDTDTFDLIQEYARTFDKEMDYADQLLLNEWIYSEYDGCVTILGFEWNVFISVKYNRPKLWEAVTTEGIKFLHFTTIKPWEPIEARNRILETVLEARREQKFGPELELWREHAP